MFKDYENLEVIVNSLHVAISKAKEFKTKIDKGFMLTVIKYQQAEQINILSIEKLEEVLKIFKKAVEYASSEKAPLHFQEKYCKLDSNYWNSIKQYCIQFAKLSSNDYDSYIDDMLSVKIEKETIDIINNVIKYSIVSSEDIENLNKILNNLNNLNIQMGQHK